MSFAALAVSFGTTVAMVRYNFARRTRNALLAGAFGAGGAVIESLWLGDLLRAAVIGALCFLVGSGGTYLGYLWLRRRELR